MDTVGQFCEGGGSECFCVGVRVSMGQIWFKTDIQWKKYDRKKIEFSSFVTFMKVYSRGT